MLKEFYRSNKMVNKLGHYIFKRICKDQNRYRKRRPMNTYGLYIQPSDIQNYINEYLNYGLDYTGDDNMSADDKIETYWDEAEGVEK